MDYNNSQGADNRSQAGVDPIVTSIYILVCCWVVIAHGVIVVCFAVNRTRPWTNYSKQILSLSLNDLSVGVICLILLIEFSFGVHTPYTVCAVSFYVFFAALCANLYHVFAICIHRAVMLVKKPTVAEPTSVKLTVILVMLAWIPAFCFCAVAFAVWGEERLDVPLCKVERVFGNQLDAAMGFLATGYVLPLICTNVVYGTTCYKLIFIWRKTFPMLPATTKVKRATKPISNNTTPGVLAQKATYPISNNTRHGVRAQKVTYPISNTTPSVRAQKATGQVSNNTTPGVRAQKATESVSNNPMTGVCEQRVTQPASNNTIFGVRAQKAPEPVYNNTKPGVRAQKAPDPVPNNTMPGVCAQKAPVPESNNTTPSVRAQKTPEPVSTNTRPGVRAQKKATVTIGLLLLFFNIFSIPLVVVMVLLFSGTEVDRNIRVLMSNVFIMNSATSPFVYAIRTKCLGQALKVFVKDCTLCLLRQERR